MKLASGGSGFRYVKAGDSREYCPQQEPSRTNEGTAGANVQTPAKDAPPINTSRDKCETNYLLKPPHSLTLSVKATTGAAQR